MCSGVRNEQNGFDLQVWRVCIGQVETILRMWQDVQDHIVP